MWAIQPAYVGYTVYTCGMHSPHTWDTNLELLKLDYQPMIVGFIRIHSNKNKLYYVPPILYSTIVLMIDTLF